LVLCFSCTFQCLPCEKRLTVSSAARRNNAFLRGLL
jgi:hypothetical protein